MRIVDMNISVLERPEDKEQSRRSPLIHWTLGIQKHMAKVDRGSWTRRRTDWMPSLSAEGGLEASLMAMGGGQVGKEG